MLICFTFFPLVLLFCQQVNYFFYIYKSFIYIIHLNINLALKSYIENYIENTSIPNLYLFLFFCFILAYFIIDYIKIVAKCIYIIRHNHDIREFLSNLSCRYVMLQILIFVIYFASNVY